MQKHTCTEFQINTGGFNNEKSDFKFLCDIRKHINCENRKACIFLKNVHMETVLTVKQFTIAYTAQCMKKIYIYSVACATNSLIREQRKKQAKPTQ